MSKVNPTIPRSKNKIDTARLAGGYGAPAAKQENVALLKRLVLANLLWENVAYADGTSVADEIATLVPLCDPFEVADITLQSRLEQKLRHTPLFLIAHMCKYETHRVFVPELLYDVITRPDMITDFLAIYKKENGGKLKPIPASVKRGLARVFNKFSEFQFAKYDRDAEIKLRDALFLVRPRPDQGKEQLFTKIANRTLSTPDTWEVALSAGADKKQTWTRLIEENKLGSLAFLRNLRNMKDVKVDANVIKKGLAQLDSQMLLPINFLAAYKNAPEFGTEIEKLMWRCFGNITKLPGYTIFIVDRSGSMQAPISGKSQFTRQDVANAMALFALLSCEEVDVWGTAGSDIQRGHKTKKIDYPVSGFGLFKQITDLDIGSGGIFTRQCLDHIREHTARQPDRIIVFSDSQDCDHYSSRLPNPFGKNNYIVDVSSHKHGVNYKGVWTAEISGWSENFLTYIQAAEGLKNYVVEETN